MYHFSSSKFSNFIYIVFLISTISCINLSDSEVHTISSHEENDSIAPFSPPKITWGLDLPTYKYANVFVSGQPNQMSVLYYRANNINTIVDLREVSPEQNNLKSKAKNFEINYFNIPILSKSFYLDLEKFNEFTMFMKNNLEKSIIVISETTDLAACAVAGSKSLSANLNREATLNLAYSIGLLNEKDKLSCKQFFEQIKL